MKRCQRYGFIVPPLLLTVVLAVNCQRLDPNLTGGSRMASTVGEGGSTGTEPEPGLGGSGMGGSGMGGAGAVQANCPSLRTQAYAVLQTNCAFCHQAPGNPLYYTAFNFILDLAPLTSMVSPLTSEKYVVKGDPAASFIYKRVVTGSMPPAGRTQRPSQADKDILNQWITSCIGDPSSPDGWSSSMVDAGAVDAGPTLDSCGPTNNCPTGSCCVFNTCRPNGTTCGQLPSPIPGQGNLPGIPGMCMSGSCQTAAGASCGKVGEPCCDLMICTAVQSSCLTTDLTKCSACGSPGQPCCKPQNCTTGNACVGFGVGRVGMCEVCGGLDQPCCGSGLPAQMTCNSTFVCIADSTTVSGSRCVAAPTRASGGGGI
jgi:hypothetical protein